MSYKEVTGPWMNLLLVSMLLSFCVNAQKGLPGQVIDAVSGQPVSGAAVFINNSTYAAACDEKGIFYLPKTPSPPFDLVITAVGYKLQTLKVEQVNVPGLLIKLQQKVVDLGEVTVVSAEKDGWVKYGQLFTEEFIGYSPFAAQCKIVNKEVLQFRYDKGSNTLKVWAEKPLQIRNDATGYLITYQLEDFEKDFGTRKLYYKGYAQFAGLPAKKEKQIRKWDDNRQYAYKGSLNHFFRTVYRGTTGQEGFEVRALKRIAGKDYGRYVPLWTDTISFTDKERVAGLLREIYKDTSNKQSMIAALTMLMQWKNGHDTGAIRIAAPPGPGERQSSKEYLFVSDKASREKMVVSCFDLNRLSPGDSIKASQLTTLIKVDGKPARLPVTSVCDIVYKPLLKVDSFVTAKNAATAQFRFHDYLQITYTLEPEEAAYINKENLGAKVPAPDQVSVINLTEDAAIIITPDGNFTPPYRLFIEKYWSYEKLDKMLPLDYEFR